MKGEPMEMQGEEKLQVLIVGAGGLGRETCQYALDTLPADRYQISGHLDDDPEREGRNLQVPIWGAIRSHVPQPNNRYLLAIGEPETRAAVAERMMADGAHFLTLIHPLAYVASSAEVGLGCILAPYATVGAGAVLDRFVHLHFYSSSAHDTRIGEFASLSPYAVANGESALGRCAFLGSHATINPTKRVGANSRVTAGSVVYRDVPADAIASGNPAKSRPRLRSGFAAQGPGST